MKCCKRAKSGFLVPVRRWLAAASGQGQAASGTMIGVPGPRPSISTIPHPMRVLFLAMEAFGGLGGIAKYNRDLLRALCAAPEVSEVVAVPRRMARGPGDLASKLTYITGGSPCQPDAYINTMIRLLTKRFKI